MEAEFTQLTKQQVISLLVEIAELRCKITDLTKERDYYQRELDLSLDTHKNLREEMNTYSDRLTAIKKICLDFNIKDVCGNCSPRDCDGCTAPLETLREKILLAFMEAQK